VSQYGEDSDWIQNIKQEPKIVFEVHGSTFQGIARVVAQKKEPELSKEVAKLMHEKYNWNEGTIVELRPEPGSIPN
jgi:hypothetical protein